MGIVLQPGRSTVGRFGKTSDLKPGGRLFCSSLARKGVGMYQAGKILEEG